MSERPLWGAVLSGAACALLIALPAAPASAAKPAKAISLVSAATVPGFAAPQRYVLKVDAKDMSTVRIVSRPDPATVVLVDRTTTTVRRHGRTMQVLVKPCVQGTMRITLVPGPPDALALVRRLLPGAQQEGLNVWATKGATLGPDLGAGYAFRLFFDVPPERADKADRARTAVAAPWTTAPDAATTAIQMDVKRLRKGGTCRPTRDVDADPNSTVDPLVRVWILGLQGIDPFAEAGRS